eukprot:SAG31_NODE_24936_length_471_cov_1.467742_1_plen_39_part_10
MNCSGYDALAAAGLKSRLGMWPFVDGSVQFSAIPSLLCR